MSFLLRAKEVVKAFYEKYDRYFNALIRFVFALVVFLTIMHNTGYNQTITNPFVALGLALVCAFLPAYVITILGAALLLVEFLSVSIYVSVILLILFLLVLLLYFVFKASDSWIMMLTMCICLWNFAPALLPLALLFSPIQILVVIFGTFTYGFISTVMKDIASLADATSKLSMGNKISLLLTDIFTNEKFLMITVTLAASMLLITLIRRSRINDAPFIAVVAGDFLFLVVFLLGNYFLRIPFTLINYIWLGVGMIANALVAFFIITFVLSMDYKRTEDVQFEDESYYYYVKAIPKTTISITNKQVHHITKEGDEEINTDQVFVNKEEKN